VRAPFGGLILLAAWTATLALLARFGSAIWRSELLYVVTDKHVMWKRRRLRRMIDRAGISYARIHWHPSIPGVGDLELVRAVPTGALRRRLSLTLPGVVAPDRLWAIIRGIAVAGGTGRGDRPLSQRLDEGERVLWSARPVATWRTYLPVGWRGAATALTAAAVVGALSRELGRGVPALGRILGAGLDARSPVFLGLAAGVALTALLLACVAIGLGYWAFVRPARLNKITRYLITDRRVLIQRGRDELCLDRERIVDVIATPLQNGLRDLFLVLDGPNARALAAGGAFGERDVEGLTPVLHSVWDADEASDLLRLRSGAPPPLTDAA
jgi:hypothetical protein